MAIRLWLDFILIECNWATRLPRILSTSKSHIKAMFKVAGPMRLLGICVQPSEPLLLLLSRYEPLTESKRQTWLQPGALESRSMEHPRAKPSLRESSVKWSSTVKR
jgi:hypothetical protein